ncbi:radical SAM protein, partial [Thermodesulfobacteriota bacterium]
MKNITRRQFIGYGATLFSTATRARVFRPFTAALWTPWRIADIRGEVFKKDAPKTIWKWSHEGFLYQKLSNQKVRCDICPHQCILEPGDRSICRSKINRNGVLY